MGAALGDSVRDEAPEAQRRRSTRIVESVPVTVTGVDALGRPFQERTSTLILNSHGCRYKSKHYVLKNMWVTLEVPHPRAEHEPRQARARVLWIQRPRSVRDLFQVGVELEKAGNMWGISAPPADWISLPDEESRPEHENNLRTMPLNFASEPSATLAWQVARLVNDAKEQLHSAIRQSAAEAVTAEARPLMEALRSQLQDKAQQWPGDILPNEPEARFPAGSFGLPLQNGGEHDAESGREQYKNHLANQAEQAAGQLTARLSEMQAERETAFATELEGRIQRAIADLENSASALTANMARAQDNFEQFCKLVEERASASVHEVEQRLRAEAEASEARVSQAEHSAGQLQADVLQMLGAAQTEWQKRVDAGVAEATNVWQERLENSVASAVARAGEQLTAHADEIAARVEETIRVRMEQLARTAAAAAAETDTRQAAAWAAIAEANSVSGELERKAAEFSAQVSAVSNTAHEELGRRNAEMLEQHRRELERQVSESIASCTERLRPAMESTGQDAAGRLIADLERELSARGEHANSTLARLESGTRAAEKLLNGYEIRMTEVAANVESAADRASKAAAELESTLAESCRNITSKWMAEIETRASETAHSTFESLFKTAEWYEKKVQAHTQASFDAAVDEATSRLHGRTAEISTLFATELDHYSRSHIEHSRGEMQEATRENLALIRENAARITEASSESLGQRVENHVQSALKEFRAQSGAMLGETVAQLENQAAVVRLNVEKDIQHRETECREAIAQRAEHVTSEANRAMGAQADAFTETVRAQCGLRERELGQALASLGDKFLEEYQRQVAETSEEQVPATLEKLRRLSEEQTDMLAKSAEARLRDVCGRVLANVGEVLRQQLLDVSKSSGNAATDNPYPSNS